MAAGARAAATYQSGLGVGDGGAPADALRRGPKSDFNLRQLKHAHDGRVLRGIRRGSGTATGPAARISLYAEARQLAQYRGKRTECADASMFTRPSVWRNPAIGRGNCRVVHVQ